MKQEYKLCGLYTDYSNAEQDRQCKYVQLNTAARSCNHYYRREAISITYSECGFVFLPWIYGM
jgi:hypothetical protein